MRIKTGIDGTPMPGVADLATDTDLWNLAHYIQSLARKPVWDMNADELTAHYARVDQDRAVSPVERGRQLSEVCAHCHSPVDTEGRILPGMMFAGGQRMTLSAWGDTITTNLTSDKDTGIGAYSDTAIVNAVTRGIRRDGTRMLPFPMGWTAWAHWSDADQKAIVAFLRTIRPVHNRITPPARPGFVRYLTDKFRMLILGADDPIIVHAGNAGVLAAGQVRQ
jgi:mono/diheme cytochrome c family protein